MPLQAVRWFLAERYGWTLSYIDTLTFDDLHEEAAVQNAKHKFIEYERERASKRR